MMESAEMFASNIFKSALDLIMSVSWIAITVVVLVAAVTYFFRRYTIMCIGRKLNARSDWMPFVPIACYMSCVCCMRAHGRCSSSKTSVLHLRCSLEILYLRYSWR